MQRDSGIGLDEILLFGAPNSSRARTFGELHSSRSPSRSSDLQPRLKRVRRSESEISIGFQNGEYPSISEYSVSDLQSTADNFFVNSPLTSFRNLPEGTPVKFLSPASKKIDLTLPTLRTQNVASLIDMGAVASADGVGREAESPVKREDPDHTTKQLGEIRKSISQATEGMFSFPSSVLLFYQFRPLFGRWTFSDNLSLT